MVVISFDAKAKREVREQQLKEKAVRHCRLNFNCHMRNHIRNVYFDVYFNCDARTGVSNYNCLWNEMNRLLNLICALEASDRDVDFILSALSGLCAHITPTLIIMQRHQHLLQVARFMRAWCCAGYFASNLMLLCYLSREVVFEYSDQ